MKSGLMIAGVIVVISGLVWAAQGAGIFPYPASSFMVNESRWISIGLATAAAGLVAIVVSLKL